ncbi:XrtA system polysaccharide chain length determinant [Rhodocyclaceae bacterium SMB388]
MEELLAQINAYLRGMWRYRWWGLAVAWIVAAGGIAFVYQMPDQYRSSARVFVDTQSVLRPLMRGLAVQPNVEQQVAILSRTLITRPNVEKLITMADLDLTVKTETEREELISRLQGGLRIGGDGSRGTQNIFTLSFQDESPERAQRIVQSLVSLFVESGLVSQRQGTDDARRFIEAQISNYEQRLVDAENRLKDFRLRNMALLGDGSRDFVSQIAALSEQLAQAELELKEAQNTRSSLQRQIEGEEPVLLPSPGRAMSATIPELDRRIEAQQQNLDNMLLRFTDQHPDVVGARRVIESLEQEKQRELALLREIAPEQFGALDSNPVFQQMRISLSSADARVASLTARATELQSRIDALRNYAELLPQIEAEQAQLNRDYAVHKRNYDELVSRRESAAMTAQLDAQSGAEFRVIDPPSLPTSPSAPNRLVLVPLAGVLGLGAGIALAFLLAQIRPTIIDARMLRSVTGLPLLGTVSLVRDPAVVRSRRVGLFMFSSLILLLGAAVGAATVALQMLQG